MSDERADEAREANRALYASDDSRSATASDRAGEEIHDDRETDGDGRAATIDRTGASDDGRRTEDRETLLAALSIDSRTLVRGAARVDSGLGDERRVVERAVRRFFRRHDDLRSAALDAAERAAGGTEW